MRSPILLLHPPVVKPCEPPAGIARLAGALHHHGIPYTAVDMNIEALLGLMNGSLNPTDRWTLRAARNLLKNLHQIRNPAIRENFDRYQRTVMDLNRFIEMSLPSGEVRLSLANYQHQELSPVRSSDLLRAAETPEANPFFPYFHERLDRIIEAENPALVGLSLNYLSQALCTFAVLGFLRHEYPEITLVLGGGLVTSWMRRPGWQNPFHGLVDHLVAGAGERALLSLAGIDDLVPTHVIPDFDFVSTIRQAGVTSNAGEFSKIPLNPPLEKGDFRTAPLLRDIGTAPPFRDFRTTPPFRKGGVGGIWSSLDPPEIHNSTVLRVTDPNVEVATRSSTTPTQDPGLRTQDGSYLSPGFILPYSASSGCYWNKCAFCPERAECSPYQPIPVDRVVGNVQSLVEKTKPVLLHVLDNAISPRLLKAFANNPPGAPWYGFARVTRHFAEEDFCIALKRSGCTMLQLGIESGDQRVLDNEHKGINLDVVSLALKNLKKAGIAAYVYLLFGTPTETLKEARNTLEFTMQHANEIGFLNLAIFNLPIYGEKAQALDTRMHYDGDLSLYADFHHPKGWHRAQVRQFLDKEFKRKPAIASILRRDPPIFSSNHAPFFTDFE
jgi:radical SAM superfamily enzyme YgiQ (UPF0313 family)